MDLMYITYFEETEELLQKAEDCLIQLELGYSSNEIHELFRIAHSIKGSSQMIGYDEIGNLTHKIEDLLDHVRKGRIHLDSEVMRLCFEGLDYVKTMVEFKKTSINEPIGADVRMASDKLGEEIALILDKHSESKNKRTDPPSTGIVHALKETKGTLHNRYYISVSFSDDAPMVQALLFMIFNNIKELGTLAYSNISDEHIYDASADCKISSCVMILNTDVEAAELYPYFEINYVENVAIIDISDSRLHEQAVPYDNKSVAFFELFFNEYIKMHPLLFQGRHVKRAALIKFIREQSESIVAEANRVRWQAMLPEIEQFYHQCLFLLEERTKRQKELARTTRTLRHEYMKLLEKVYGFVRGKMIYKTVKARDRHFMKRLNGMAERMDKSRVRKIFIDVSDLPSLDEYELMDLIGLKRQLDANGISISMIAGIPLNKRIVNIFESILPLEYFGVYGTELEAVLSDA